MEKRIGYLLTQSFFEVFEQEGGSLQKRREETRDVWKKVEAAQRKNIPLEETVFACFFLFPIFFVDERKTCLFLRLFPTSILVYSIKQFWEWVLAAEERETNEVDPKIFSGNCINAVATFEISSEMRNIFSQRSRKWCHTRPVHVRFFQDKETFLSRNDNNFRTN